MPALLKDQLKDFSKQKNYKAIVDTMVSSFQAQNVSENEKNEQRQQISEFLYEELNGEKKAAEEFAVQFINAAADVYYGGIFQIGSKRDEWEKKIKKGEVPEMKAVSDDKKLANKVANQIVLAHEKESFIGYDLMTVLNGEFGQKNIKINETEGKAFLENKLLEARERKAKEFGINPDKLADYEWDFKNQEAYITGFEVKKEKPAEGESLFTNIPDYLKKIKDCKTPEELDALEEEYFELEEANFLRGIKAASAAKIYKKLYADFEELDKGEENRSAAHRFTKKYLENAARLGKDYIIMDPNVPADLVKPSASLGWNIIDNATGNLVFPADEFYDELDERARNNRENGITGEKAAHDIDFKNNVADVYNLTKRIRNINKEFKDFSNSKRPNHDIDNDKKIRGYISQERKNRDYYCVDQIPDDGYCKTLTEQEKNLSDSLMNDLVTFEGYDRLFKLIEENKRLYKKKAYVEASLLIDGEDYHEAHERHDAAYKANCEELRAQILACKEFEKTFDEPANLAGPGMDRTKLLDRMSKVLSREPNRAVDYEKVRDIWSVQNEDLDNIWIGYQFLNMSILKQSGDLFSEEKREKYGFNPDGDVSKSEMEFAKDFAKAVLKNCAEEKNLPTLKKLIQSVGRFRIKCIVKVGKDYDDIRNALEGEENADLKARYLFAEHAVQFGYPGLDEIDYSLNTVVTEMIPNGALADEVDMNDKNLTIGEYLDAIGASEKGRAAYYKKSGYSADKKFSEIFKNEVNYSADVAGFAAELLITANRREGQQYEMDRLSGTDKKYLDYHENNITTEKNKADYTPIDAWIKSEGKKLGDNLEKVLLVDKMQNATATLTTMKLAGVDPKSEVGRFYRNSLDERNTYVTEVLRDKKDPDEVVEKLVNEKKSEKLVKFSVKKLPANYNIYILKHTAGRGGETADEMVDNLSKVLAASALEKMGKSFSVKGIRSTAEKLKKTLVLDVMKGDEKRLREALRDQNSAVKLGDEIRQSIFGVKPENTKHYFKEMERLYLSLSGTKGRSTKYTAFHKAVEEAAELKDKKMSPEEMQDAIINANIKIHEAVQNYVSGKEKVRRSDKGNDSFNHALDAMAVIEKYVPGFRIHSVNLINGINKVRNDNNAEAENFISHENFTQKFGADHAREITNAQRRRQDAAQRKTRKIDVPI